MLSVIIAGVLAAAALPSTLQPEVPAIRDPGSLLSYFANPYDPSFAQDQKNRISQQELQASEPEFLRQAQTSAATASRELLVAEDTISWVLEDSKGQEYHLTVTQEEYLKNTADVPTLIKYLETKDGSVIAVRDYSRYVRPTAELSQLADGIYENAGNDYQFIYEVWYVATHATEYAHEDAETVSPPLKTLYESRGDCEDLTILVASIIKASSYTRDWSVKMAYLDASNPDPDTVNHVALFIQTDRFSTFVETTNSDLNGLSVWKRVSGWYVDVA